MNALSKLAMGAVAALAIAGAASSASATTVIDNWTNVPNQPITLTFSDNKISDATGAGIYVNGADASDGTSFHQWDGVKAFTDTFNFTLPTGNVGFDLGTISFQALSGMKFTSVTFNGVALTLIKKGTYSWDAYTPDPIPVVFGGPQVLIVKGEGGANASWAGTGTFNPVPEPGTWALMIIGFGGAGAMIRSRRRALAAAA